MSTTNVKLAPYTAGSEFAISGESAVSVVLAGRAALPYPPGNVLINGAAFPSTTSGDVTMTWNHRYRPGPFVVAQNAGDVPGGPEGTYTVTVSVNGVLKHTTTGITGKTFTYTYAQRGIDDANMAHATEITITPVNGALVGQARTLTFVMGP